MDKATTIEQTLNFSDSVLEKIAGQTANQVDGVLELSGGIIGNLADRFRDNTDPTKGVDVEINDQDVTIEIDAILEYGKSAPKIFDQVSNQIAKSIHEMTGLTVAKITMNVQDLMSKQAWLAENESNTKTDSKKAKDKKE